MGDEAYLTIKRPQWGYPAQEVLTVLKRSEAYTKSKSVSVEASLYVSRLELEYFLDKYFFYQLPVESSTGLFIVY